MLSSSGNTRFISPILTHIMRCDSDVKLGDLVETFSARDSTKVQISLDKLKVKMRVDPSPNRIYLRIDAFMKVLRPYQ